MILSDRFIWLLSAAMLLAACLPVSGRAVQAAQLLSSAGIFVIFLLHGIRLERHEVAAGMRNMRLQGAIFGFVFGIMTVLGLVLSKLATGYLPPELTTGILFLGILPSTLQSAASYCAIAKGNVAASVIASALVNISGIVISPLLFAALASAAGVTLSTDIIIRILLVLLLPFILGQIVQRWTRPWVLRQSAILGWTDKVVIAMIVYISFSGAVVAGTLKEINGAQVVILLSILAVFLLAAFAGAWALGKVLRLPVNDRKTLLFSGAQKSIAIGAPMATVLFSPQMAGIILLPVLLYHLSQMILSAPLALHLSLK